MPSTNYIIGSLAAFSILLSFANAEESDLDQLSNTTVRSEYGSNFFREYFDEGNEGLLKKYWFSGYWGNGQPFNVGWDPAYYKINQYNVLELLLKKVNYFWSDNGVEKYWPWTAGELKSRDFYSTGE